jgi:hypothetical protein
MGVGADIEAHCGRCGTTWHVVVAMVDGRVAQVECRECGRRHRARTGPTGAPRAHRRTGETSTRAARAAKPIVEADREQPAVAYSTKQTYRPGQRIEHPAFGPGVVERVLGATKVQIFFAGGSRILAQGLD